MWPHVSVYSGVIMTTANEIFPDSFDKYRFVDNLPVTDFACVPACMLLPSTSTVAICC